MTTLLPSSRSQPREGKSARALFPVLREAPTSCASSSGVRSCVTRSWPPSTEPNRCASCSNCLATRPGTSTKIRSASIVLVRRSRRATTRSSCMAICGRSVAHFCSADLGSRASRASVPTVAGAGVEQRELAELVGRAVDRDEVLPAVRRTAAELHLPAQDDVEAVAGLALVEQHGAARRVEDLELTRQRLDVL